MNRLSPALGPVICSWLYFFYLTKGDGGVCWGSLALALEGVSLIDPVGSLAALPRPSS